MLPRRNHACRVCSFAMDGLDIVVMENRFLRISVLTSLGATIYELNDKRSDTDFMHRTRRGLANPTTRLLTVQNPQGGFWDVWPGGWFEMFPNSGRACDFAGTKLGQHGEVFYQPWNFAVLCDEPGRVSVRFSVDSNRLPFHLSRVMTLQDDMSAIFISEEIRNDSAQSLFFLWGHHITLGDAFLNEHCRFNMPGCIFENKPEYAHPRSRVASGATGELHHMPKIEGGFVDLTCLPDRASATGEMLFANTCRDGWFTVTDEQKQLGFAASWDTDMFGSAWLWEEFCALEDYPFFGDTYAISIEPQVSEIPTLRGSADKNKAKMLQPGEVQKAWLTASVYHTVTPVWKSLAGANLYWFE